MKSVLNVVTEISRSLQRGIQLLGNGSLSWLQTLPARVFCVLPTGQYVLHHKLKSVVDNILQVLFGV